MKSSTKTKIAILAIAFITQSTMAVSAIISKLTNVFPDAEVTTIQLTMTLPMITGLVLTLLVGAVMSKWRKKPVTIVLLVLCLTSIIPLAVHSNLEILLIVAACMGGYTAITPVGSALISEHFEDHELNSMIGLNTGVGAVGSIVFSVVGGVLADWNWHYLYAIYIAVIPVFILALFFLPKGQKPAAIQKQHEHTDETVKGNGKLIVTYIALLAVFMILQYTSPLNSSLLLAERGYSEASLAGVYTAVSNVCAAVGGFLYGKISAALKKYIFLLPALLGLAAFALLYLGKNIVLIYVSAGLVGAALSFMSAATMAKCATLVSPKRVPLSMSVTMACVFLSAAISPNVIGAFTPLVGSDSASAKVLITMFGFVILFIAHLVLALCVKDKAKAATQ